MSHKVISAINQDSVFDLISKFGDHMKNVLIYDRIAQGIQDFCANNSIDEVCNMQHCKQQYCSITVNNDLH